MTATTHLLLLRCCYELLCACTLVLELQQDCRSALTGLRELRQGHRQCWLACDAEVPAHNIAGAVNESLRP